MNDAQVIYAFAHVESWLEAYARSNQLSAYELTNRVATLLHVQTGGKILGLEDSLSTLRGDAAGNKATRKMALARGSYSETPGKHHVMSAAARKRISDAQKRRWAKQKSSGIKAYWAAMTPEERSKEMLRRRRSRA